MMETLWWFLKWEPIKVWWHPTITHYDGITSPIYHIPPIKPLQIPPNLWDTKSLKSYISGKFQGSTHLRGTPTWQNYWFVLFWLRWSVGVPNLPYGVERAPLHLNSLTWTKRVPNLPCGVERLFNRYRSVLNVYSVPNLPCGVEKWSWKLDNLKLRITTTPPNLSHLIHLCRSDNKTFPPKPPNHLLAGGQDFTFQKPKKEKT